VGPVYGSFRGCDDGEFLSSDFLRGGVTSGFFVEGGVVVGMGDLGYSFFFPSEGGVSTISDHRTSFLTGGDGSDGDDSFMRRNLACT